jgi:ribonuclease VapC
MIVDSSAIVAILKEEPGFDNVLEKLFNADMVSIGAPTYVETSMVVDGRRDPIVSRALDDLLGEFEMEMIAFTPEHARIARAAFRDFGRGSGHAAKLNFGDCLAYAVAKERKQPLLFVGDDFPYTDIEPA